MASTLKRSRPTGAAREDEWAEFIADCGKFKDEIAKEISKQKFTLAELDEEEQSLDRLRRWFRSNRSKDVFATASAARADEELPSAKSPAKSLATRTATAPLYAAGFVTAFGAHSIAAGLGAHSGNIGLTLLNLGILLAVYDLAEVLLKPVFGSLSDRIGAKPVIVGGLLAFALLSLIGLWAADPFMLGLARLGQGAAAAAFSPASSAMVARLAAGRSSGTYFGRYGSWKSLGYVIGPLLGAALIFLGGFTLLFLTLSALAAATAVWAVVALPRLEPLPRPRYTVLDLARRVTHRSFLVPTLVLAATGAPGAAIGFLPALGTQHGLDPTASIAAVSVLAVASAVIQPLIGRLRDQKRLTDSRGMTAGLLLAAAGITGVALLPGPATLFLAAAAIGAGIGIATPLGFAHLADTTPPERLGRTMGTAELGRELGDVGGPLLVGGIGMLAGLPLGLGRWPWRWPPRALSASNAAED